MFRYVIRRLVVTIPVMFAISIATFLLMRIVVGDPVQLISGQDATVGQGFGRPVAISAWTEPPNPGPVCRLAAARSGW